MNERSSQILNAVVREYVGSAVPVSSSILASRYHFALSSATIRNELAWLEKEGYLYQPHTSAGRIPTDKGYRYFVDKIMERKKLSENEQRTLKTEILKMKAQQQRLIRTTVKLLSALSNNLALSTFDKDSFFDSGMLSLLKQPEFKDTDKICQIVEALDYLDEHVNKLNRQVNNKAVEVYIGKENPLALEDCSMIVSGIKLKGGENGLLAIIGPKRMDYDRNVSLIDYLRKLISLGSVVIVVGTLF